MYAAPNAAAEITGIAFALTGAEKINLNIQYTHTHTHTDVEQKAPAFI